MEEETQSAAKRHLPLPRTVEISIARFLHVDDGNLFVVVLILLFFFVFSSRERPSSSTCCYGFVREREGKCRCRLSKETDGRLCWTTVQTSSAQLLGGGSQRRSAGASQILQYPPCSWYDGTWTFSLYRSPSDLSGCCHQHLGPSPPCHLLHHNTLEIEFTESHYQGWVTAVCMPVVCVCLGCQCVEKDRTLRTVDIYFLSGAKLNFIFKLLIELCSLNKLGIK